MNSQIIASKSLGTVCFKKEQTKQFVSDLSTVGENIVALMDYQNSTILDQI
jgi:hypothetical protein